MSERPASPVPKIWKSEDEPAFGKSFELELDDHIAVDYASGRLLPAGLTVGAVMFVALFVALILYFDRWQAGEGGAFALHVTGFVALFALASALLLKPARRLVRHFYGRHLKKLGAIETPIESTIDKDAVSFIARGQTITCPWESLHALEEDEGTFYFWLSTRSVLPWPARIFASEQERQAFRDSVEKWAGRPFGPPALARLGERGRANLPD